MVAGVLLLAGCTSSAPHTASGSAAPSSTPRYSAEAAIIQGRTDYTRNVFALSITNTGAQSMAIRSATLDSPRFGEPVVIDDHVVTLAAGDTIDLRAPIPPLACDGAEEAGRVELVIGETDAPTTLALVPTDPNKTLDRLLDEGCLVRDLDAVVTVTPPAALRMTGEGAASVAWIDVGFEPTGEEGSATFDGVRSTTLMSPPDADHWPLGFTIDAASEARVVSLEMVPTRCDQHALADDKVGTVLVIDASTSTGRAGRYLLPLPPTVKAEVLAFIAARCGL